MESLLTATEAARKLGRTTQFLSGAMAALDVRPNRVGKTMVIKEEDFRRLQFLRKGRRSSAVTIP